MVAIENTERFGHVFMDRLSPSDRRDLMAQGRRVRLPGGATGLIEGQVSGQVLLLLKGHVRAWSTSSHGHQSLLAVRRPGDLVGELSALDGRPHSATVSTLETVEALAISASSFRSFL
ncbi:MAG TPA: cyclic nucleotide-binding domain-containing protein, partial [Actinomycetota bacterium]|nr:cyclic nucleotide-binding domain-containing protein [Actinomycetota bacterium]